MLLLTGRCLATFFMPILLLAGCADKTVHFQAATMPPDDWVFVTDRVAGFSGGGCALM